MSEPHTSAPARAGEELIEEAPFTATAAAERPLGAGDRRPVASCRSRRCCATCCVLVISAVGAVILLEITDPFTNSQLASVTYYAIAAGGLTVLTG